MTRPDGVVSLCVGTGRCGTTFLASLAEREPDVAASHERLRLAATFHMYCAWHGIPVDPEGFLVDREAAVRDDLAAHRVSFEASALLSHSLEVLHERFGARILLLVRRPDHCVGSFTVRGWFEALPQWGDPTRPPSYREGEEPRHFFGRNLPRGREAYARWAARTPLGRVAWFWQARNRAVIEQLARLPAADVRIARLEDLDHAGYCDVARFLGWSPTLDAATYDALASSRPNTGPNPPRRADAWSEREAADFEAEVAPLAAALGYEHRVDALRAGAPAVVGPVPSPADALARLG
ncbi:MAG: hypothetical protein R3F59_12545 [Myxococcota bacterium]